MLRTRLPIPAGAELAAINFYLFGTGGMGKDTFKKGAKGFIPLRIYSHWPIGHLIKGSDQILVWESAPRKIVKKALSIFSTGRRPATLLPIMENAQNTGAKGVALPPAKRSLYDRATRPPREEEDMAACPNPGGGWRASRPELLAITNTTLITTFRIWPG